MERKQTVITRHDKFTVASKETNQYGDLIVRDTDGLDHKIGNKRARLFDVFQEGAEVQVGYAEYMQKEYIATAEQTGIHNVAQQVAKLPSQKPISPPPQKGEPPKTVSQEIKENMEWKSDQITINMFWRILADLIMHKEIDTTKSAGKALRTALMAKMLSVLDIKIANKEP